jgi:hypothetical protein
MALRKEQITDDYDEENQPMKERTRITIDISPELRRRIKLAAFENDLSISGYIGRILENAVPDEEDARKRHPVTQEMFDKLMEIRDQIAKERDGEPFEDSVELIRQMREERTRYLEELREKS